MMEEVSIEHLLTANSSTRIKSKDMFMLMALWMEKYPLHPPPKTSTCVRPTGCTLVDPRDRIVSLECTRESHAIVRAILACPDPFGCDIYVSRFPCALCTKVMVQAGIRKVYYFPAKEWEIDWEAVCRKTLPDFILQEPVKVTTTNITGHHTTTILDSKGYTGSSRNSISPIKKTRQGWDTSQALPEETTTASSSNNASVRAIDAKAAQAFVESSDSFVSSASHSSSNIQPAYVSPPRLTGGAHFGSNRRYSSPHKQPAPLHVLVNEKQDKNYRAVLRLITNNSIAMSLHIPHWDHSEYQGTLQSSTNSNRSSSVDGTSFPKEMKKSDTPDFTKMPPKPSNSGISLLSFNPKTPNNTDDNPSLEHNAHESTSKDFSWTLDPNLASMPALCQRWPTIVAKFEQTLRGMQALASLYTKAKLKYFQHRPAFQDQMKMTSPGVGLDEHEETSVDTTASDILTNLREPGMTSNNKAPHQEQMPKELPSVSPEEIERFRHAIVLAHIAAKRTDDAKVGVGAVLLSADGRYLSVGWNGYPKKAAHLDYPTAGADDLIEDEDELKYDYVLHAEQNALLWRNPPGHFPLQKGATVVTTKMPCDECSPVMADCGVSRVVTRPQMPKSWDDPARIRGLTYEKLGALFQHSVYVFE